MAAVPPSRPHRSLSSSKAGPRPVCKGQTFYLSGSVRTPLISSLTSTSHVSALAVGSFLCVHLAPPLVLGIGKVLTLAGVASETSVEDAIDTASRIMLLGRVYYQSAFTEPLLYLALGLHALSSSVKRIVLTYTTSIDSPSATPSLPPPSSSPKSVAPTSAPQRNPSLLHTISGYILVPLVGHHVLLNRIVPSSSSPPISQLSPSELDYGYISFGLGSFPILTPVLYGTLIAAATVHAAMGATKVVARSRKRAAKRMGGPGWSLVGTGAGLLVAGLAALAPASAASGQSWRLSAVMERRARECYRLAGLRTSGA